VLAIVNSLRRLSVAWRSSPTSYSSSKRLLRVRTHSVESSGLIMTRLLETSVCLYLYWLASVESFVGPSHHTLNRLRTIKDQVNGKSISRHTFTDLSFFRRKSTDDEVPTPDTTNGEPSSDETDSQSSSLFNFMRRNEKKPTSTAVEDSGSDTDDSAATTTTSTVTLAPPSEVIPPLNATEEAARLRSEADRARLEAERLDAELTLRKIERLEKELASISAAAQSNETNGKASTSRKSPQDIQREIDGLLRKVRGDSGRSRTNINTTQAGGATLSSATKGSNPSMERLEPAWPKIVRPFQQEEYDKIYNNVKDLPQFMKGSMALLVEAKIGVDPVTGKTLVDATDLADRLYRLQRFDLSFSSKEPPSFTAADVSRVVSEIEAMSNETSAEGSSWWSRSGDDEGVMMLRSMLDENEQLTELMKKDPRTFAQFALEVEYYFADVASEETAGKMLAMASEEPWLKPFVNELQFTEVDTVISNLFPKCTTKRDNADKESRIPTEAQVNQLVADILPKVNFRSASKPEAVLGGYIIRGSTSLGGDALITNIDKAMDGSSLKDKMTVLYVEDFSSDASIEAAESVLGGLRPILYVVSPNICRDSKPLQLSIVSAIGLATSWYLSIYPFLFNPKIAARVDEQLALADANMVPDLAWLTDLSVPLFATFIGIQLLHELGHLLVAGSNRIQTGSPTFVPSLLTGVTSTVTTFKTPPLNKAAMFDYSVAGPLFGLTASLLAIVIGAQLTAVSDPSLLPALPLEILRQSTLGGGLLDMGLGSGALNVPEGARGTAAVAGMTVPLHPVAVAGYFSLIVNALAILPIGSKYSFIRAEDCSTKWFIV
jgi:hypothetical protein